MHEGSDFKLKAPLSCRSSGNPGPAHIGLMEASLGQVIKAANSVLVTFRSAEYAQAGYTWRCAAANREYSPFAMSQAVRETTFDLAKQPRPRQRAGWCRRICVKLLDF